MNLIEKLVEFCAKDLSSSSLRKTISAGPWGSEEGYDWSFNRDGDATITHLAIGCGAVVHYIMIHYELDGVKDHVILGGNSNISICREVEINWAEEYLTSIKGTYTSYNDRRGFKGVAIDGLTFVTNVREYGPFGQEYRTTCFELPLEGGMIVGFHGKTDREYLSSIGVYMKRS